MNKPFNIRLPQRLLDAILVAKTRIGDASVSDTARRLLERGLDPAFDVDRSQTPGMTDIQALRHLLEKKEKGVPLEVAEWSYLGERVHQAYADADLGRRYVDAALVGQVLSAFLACLRVGAEEGVLQDSEYLAYYHDKIDLEPGEDLVAGVTRQRAALALDDRCGTHRAEVLSRPLMVFLRSDGLKVSAQRLNEGLRPYLSSLLSIAIRGVAARSGSLVLPARTADEEASGFPVYVQGISVGIFHLMPSLYEHNLALIININGPCGVVLTLSNIIEVSDFFDLIQWMSLSPQGDFLPFNVKGITAYASQRANELLEINFRGVRLMLEPADLQDLYKAINAVRSDSQVSEAIIRLQWTAGYI